MEHIEEVFLNHVKDVFDYELPYQEGSWEKFQQQNRKKERAIWLQWTTKVAAVLLLSPMLLFWYHPVPVKTDKVYVTAKPVGKKHQIQRSAVVATESHLIPVPKRSMDRIVRRAPSTDTIQVNMPVTTTFGETGVVEVTSLGNIVDNQGNSVNVPAFAKQQPYLAASSKKPVEDGGGEWKISPLIATSSGTSGNLRLGFGASVAYTLNNRFAINTGAAFNQLSALRKINDAAAMGEEGKKLQSVQTAISGLDIPIELKYNLNAHHYISMGVSALGVLKQSQALNYSELKMVKISVEGDDGVVSESRLVAIEESVPVSGEELPKQNYIGFYNFSYGVSKNIGKKQVLVIEPFIKLPMRPYSNQRTSLSSGGIKLKLEF